MIFNFNKAKKKHEGQTWGAVWNQHNVEDFGHKPIYKKGTITNVQKDGIFILEFKGGGLMVCSTLKNLKKFKS